MIDIGNEELGRAGSRSVSGGSAKLVLLRTTLPSVTDFGGLSDAWGMDREDRRYRHRYKHFVRKNANSWVGNAL